jgi:predicted dinucleotide-binding enzyme
MSIPMTTIGFIGAGHIGSQIARREVANNYDVVISNSRGPVTLSALVAELGPKSPRNRRRRGKGWRHPGRLGATKELPGRFRSSLSRSRS